MILECIVDIDFNFKTDLDFFISHSEMNGDIKMHKFPALNLNKNANENAVGINNAEDEFPLICSGNISRKALN